MHDIDMIEDFFQKKNELFFYHKLGQTTFDEFNTHIFFLFDSWIWSQRTCNHQRLTINQLVFTKQEMFVVCDVCRKRWSNRHEYSD